MIFFKKYYELFLSLIVALFIALIIFIFIKVTNILVVNFDKALTVPNLSEKDINFNINDAVLILKQRKLIE